MYASHNISVEDRKPKQNGISVEVAMNLKARCNTRTAWQQLRDGVKLWVHELFVLGRLAQNRTPYGVADILGTPLEDERGPWHPITAALSIRNKDSERDALPEAVANFLSSLQFIVFQGGDAPLLKVLVRVEKQDRLVTILTLSW